MQRPLAGGGEPLAERLGHAAWHILRLTATAVGGRDQAPGRVVRRGHPEIAAQNVQAQVDARGGAGRRQHAALVDEQNVLVDPDERMPRRKRARVMPVCRGALAVQQARCGEREGARRDGGEPRAPIVRRDQRVNDGLRRVVAVREPVAGHEDDVGPCKRVEAVGDVVRQAVTAGHETGGGAAHPHLVRHARAGREHLRRNADIERLRTLEHKDGDAIQAGSWHGKRIRGGVGPARSPYLWRWHRRSRATGLIGQVLQAAHWVRACRPVPAERATRCRPAPDALHQKKIAGSVSAAPGRWDKLRPWWWAGRVGVCARPRWSCRGGFGGFPSVRRVERR